MRHKEVTVTIPAEAQEKERRVRDALARLNYDSLIITRRDNFAWLTCGGRAVVACTVPDSPVLLVLTPKRKYAVGYSMDLPRTMDEEIGGLGYEPVSLPTFGKAPTEVALELADGRAAADGRLYGAADIGDTIASLWEPYTPEEMERYAGVCRESGQVLRQLADWVEPGMTERYVAAHMWQLYLERNFEGCCMFVGSDERIKRYRHAVPSEKPIEKAVLLSPAASKYGLYVPNSRIVYFGKPPDDIRRRFQAVATMQAAITASTRPGVPLYALYELCMNLFETLGYPEERTRHYHGGPTGYKPSMPERCQDRNARVQANTAFAWYFTITGVKNEETALVDAHGATLQTLDPSWPRFEIEYEGRKVAVADIMVK